jgi:hypothetical protein
VWVSADPPNPTANPEVELWYDLDEPDPIGLSEIPFGGATDAPLTMRTDLHGDVHWGAPHLPLTGGTVATLNARNLTTATLVAPNVEGDVYLTGALSAQSVNDPSYDQYLDWEEVDMGALLIDGSGGHFVADLAIGPCRAWRNRYCILVNMCFRSSPEIAQEVWLNVAQLPPGWEPPGELWDARPSIDVLSDGPTTENRITASGMVQLRGKSGLSPDPQSTTAFCVYQFYGRSS